MQRRTWLLFALFVVVAVFYARVGAKSAEVAVSGHLRQIQSLQEAEEGLLAKPMPADAPAAGSEMDRVDNS